MVVPGLLSADNITGIVTWVVDGDTVHVASDGTKYKIRLYGIDAPETNQPYGKWSGKKLASYVLNKEVTVEVVDIDRYKRHVGIIYKGDKDINLMMVNAGYAWYYAKYCKRKDICPAYLEAEETAKTARRGLWRSLPYHPEEWRKK
ncbi:hypothetical protein AAG570_014071 [Ranatra chinensis]|uniref:TNase-like domain-containing protein n=1 Tax=Ranatra chinensis TaxID=642074 RepID=A0ABD0XS84_9HEMI